MASRSARLRSIIESMLLVSSEPLPMERIIEVIEGEDRRTKPAEIKAAAKSLIAAYGDPKRSVGSGFRIEEVSGALQLRSTPENAQYIRRLLAIRPQRLTRPALETLAIIAYRQPTTKPEIEKIRGVDSGAVLKALLERDMVRILGKKDEVGRPLLYGTTPLFLELFGMKSLAALPTLREYHELDNQHQEQVDELYEAEAVTKLSDLAATAEFLVEREHDPDLDELDAAVKKATDVDRDTKAILDPKAPKAAATPPSGDAATEPAETEAAAPEGASDPAEAAAASSPGASEPSETETAASDDASAPAEAPEQS